MAERQIGASYGRLRLEIIDFIIDRSWANQELIEGCPKNRGEKSSPPNKDLARDKNASGDIPQKMNAKIGSGSF